MRSFSLNIANYIIRFECESEQPDLVPGKRFINNIYTGSNFDIHISVHPGKFILPADAGKVFDAPFIEEINGIRVKKSNSFWSVYRHDKELYIKSIFPFSTEKKTAVLKFSLSNKYWDLWLDGEGREADPLEYPLDGLILYYLTAINGDIMIHSSGVNHAGYGYIFSGISGMGKTTMSKLWDQAGAGIIHDDRLILRKAAPGFKMFNTPVYINDKPKESTIDRIFLIGHGKKNEMIQLSGAKAVSMVLANCIQHAWDKEVVSGLIDSVSSLCSSVPVFRLLFLPDNSIIQFILSHERNSGKT